MDYRKAFLVFRKDWKEIRRNWQVLMPIVILPIIISIVIPILLSTSMAASSNQTQGIDSITKNLPASVQSEIAGMTPEQVALYVVALYLLAPFFLIIPLMTSSVIASDSFAGEKERKTIEALLATPVTDGELFLGKVLVSFIPSMAITIASFVIYSAIIDIFSFANFGRLILPNLTWIVLIFGLAPMIALASIGLSVMISSKVRGFREAQQISAILVLPLLALVFGQISGAIILGPVIILALAGVLAVFDALLFYIGVKRFGREKILSNS
jgi:ABC-2 type transport system permease protein